MADTRTHSQGSLRLHQVMQLSLARPLSSSKCGIIGVYMRHTSTDMHVFCFARNMLDGVFTVKELACLM